MIKDCRIHAISQEIIIYQRIVTIIEKPEVTHKEVEKPKNKAQNDTWEIGQIKNLDKNFKQDDH